MSKLIGVRRNGLSKGNGKRSKRTHFDFRNVVETRQELDRATNLSNEK